MNDIEKNDQALIEEFAAMEHSRWSKWQSYLHSQCFTSPEFTGALIIPADLVVRWRHQISTPYSQLSETEKESDRNEVRPYLEHMQTLIVQKNKEREEAVEAERERIRIIVESMKAEYLWDDDSKKYVANIHRENILNDVLQALNQKQHERNKV